MTTRIAICAPATPITPEQAEAVRALAAAEFPTLRLAFHDQCFAAEGHFAGRDAVRLAAFLDCANDPGSDAVWFAKGGYGSNRILPGALAGIAGGAGAGKRYLGYSDCGFLLGGLYAARLGRPAHGPMVVDIVRDGGADAVRRSLAWLADNSRHDRAGGDAPVVAFNLTTLAMLAGTRFMPDLAGHVVMVEEVAEHLYAIDRLFFHLTSQLPAIAGLRLGDVTAVPENDREFGMSVEEIARHWCGRASIPYLGRAPIGHNAANTVVPFGLARTSTAA